MSGSQIAMLPPQRKCTLQKGASELTLAGLEMIAGLRRHEYIRRRLWDPPVARHDAGQALNQLIGSGGAPAVVVDVLRL